MAKLVTNKYYTKGGIEKINGYFASIPKKVVEESGIDTDKQVTVTAEKGKIIIEEVKDDKRGN